MSGHQPYPPRVAAQPSAHRIVEADIERIQGARVRARARDDLVAELRRFGAKDVVLSTSVPLRLDGLPLAAARQPDDPGVAVYFSLTGDMTTTLICILGAHLRVTAAKAIRLRITANDDSRRATVTLSRSDAHAMIAALLDGIATLDRREQACVPSPERPCQHEPACTPDSREDVEQYTRRP